MTRRRDVARRARTRGCACSPSASRPSARSSARPRCCTSRRSCASSREENLAMIARVGRVPARGGQARAVSTPSTSSTASRDDPGYALDCLRAAADAGAERVVLCDTNGGSLPPAGRARPSLAVVAAALPRGVRWASTPTTTRAAPWPTRSPPSRRAPRQVQGTINGIGERTGNANLVTIIADLQLKMGVELLAARAAGAPDRDARTSSTSCSTARPTRPSRTSASTPSPTRPACTPPACAPTPATFEHVDPGVVGNRRELLVSELAGKRHGRREGREAGHRRSTTTAAARVVERVKELEHEGYQFEAADGSFELLMRRETGELRAAVPAGVLARDRREARRRQGRDRGDDQDLGRRRALRAHRRGQRPGQRARRGAARRRSARSTRTCATSSSSTSRSASSTRRKGTGAVTRVLHRRLRRPRRVGHDRRLTRT